MPGIFILLPVLPKGIVCFILILHTSMKKGAEMSVRAGRQPDNPFTMPQGGLH
jgi:hypothetical protein